MNVSKIKNVKIKKVEDVEKKNKKIIEHYGIRRQAKKICEEVSELHEAIVDTEGWFWSNKGNSVYELCIEHVQEEVADVLVLLDQIMLNYQLNEEEIAKAIAYKINRQIKRIEKEKKECKEEC